MHEPEKHESASRNGTALSMTDSGEPIPDETLTAGGFVKVTAFMRTAASTNAIRVRKARGKILCAGSKQVNVIAPELTHATLKLLAKEFQAGVSIGDALKAVLTAEVRATDPNAEIIVASRNNVELRDQLSTKVAAFTGWRRFVAKLLCLL